MRWLRHLFLLCKKRSCNRRRAASLFSVCSHGLDDAPLTSATLDRASLYTLLYTGLKPTISSSGLPRLETHVYNEKSLAASVVLFFLGEGRDVLFKRLAGRWPWITCDVQHAGVWMDPMTANEIRQPENPTCVTFPNNLLQPMFWVMDVDRAYPHVWVEGILVEQDSAASTVGDVKTVCEGCCCRYSIASCRATTCHFPAICLSMAPGVPSQTTDARLPRLAGIKLVKKTEKKDTFLCWPHETLVPHKLCLSCGGRV